MIATINAFVLGLSIMLKLRLAAAFSLQFTSCFRSVYSRRSKHLKTGPNSN